MSGNAFQTKCISRQTETFTPTCFIGRLIFSVLSSGKSFRWFRWAPVLFGCFNAYPRFCPILSENRHQMKQNELFHWVSVLGGFVGPKYVFGGFVAPSSENVHFHSENVHFHTTLTFLHQDVQFGVCCRWFRWAKVSRAKTRGK